jgi:hypothetical protein
MRLVITDGAAFMKGVKVAVLPDPEPHPANDANVHRAEVIDGRDHLVLREARESRNDRHVESRDSLQRKAAARPAVLEVPAGAGDARRAARTM